MKTRSYCTEAVLRFLVQGGPKKRGHSTFSRISSNTFSQKSSELHKIIIRFLHTSRPVYNEHAYNIRVHSFYYLKWRHLLNLFPLDNTTLKLQHNSVGRHHVHRKDKRCVCGTRGQGQQSILVMRRFWLTVTAFVQRYGYYK